MRRSSMDRAPCARWNWIVDTVQDTGREVAGSSPVVASQPNSYAILVHSGSVWHRIIGDTTAPIEFCVLQFIVSRLTHSF